MSALPSSRKTHSEKHKQIFRQLLKESPNKSCVDCKSAQHPRWASWNLGCFICIRCSGIHRSMGTHISRVKSVDLDVWTDEQVESMIKWGNEKCNLFWEARLPAHYVPDPLKIENFIRTKYDMKKWAALPNVPDPMALPAGRAAGLAPGKQAGPDPAAPAPHPAEPPAASLRQPSLASVSAPSLLDDDFGAFASSAPPAPSPSAGGQPTHATAPGFSPRGPVRASTTHFASAPQPAPQAPDPRSDLKKSILSLYSSPASSSSSVYQNQHQHQHQHRQHPAYSSPAGSLSPLPRALPAQTPPAQPVAGLSDSLVGLKIGPEPAAGKTPSASAGAPSPLPRLHTATPAKTRTAVPAAPSQWANEWTDGPGAAGPWAPAPAYNGSHAGSSVLGAGFAGTFAHAGPGASAPAGLKSAATTDLDDDLFKNVWD